MVVDWLAYYCTTDIVEIVSVVCYSEFSLSNLKSEIFDQKHSVLDKDVFEPITWAVNVTNHAGAAGKWHWLADNNRRTFKTDDVKSSKQGKE